MYSYDPKLVWFTLNGDVLRKLSHKISQILPQLSSLYLPVIVVSHKLLPNSPIEFRDLLDKMSFIRHAVGILSLFANSDRKYQLARPLVRYFSAGSVDESTPWVYTGLDVIWWASRNKDIEINLSLSWLLLRKVASPLDTRC